MFNGDTTYATLFHYKSRPPDTDATLILPPTPFPDVGAPYTALGTAPPPTLPLAAPPAAPPTPTIPPVDTEIVVASGGGIQGNYQQNRLKANRPLLNTPATTQPTTSRNHELNNATKNVNIDIPKSIKNIESTESTNGAPTTRKSGRVTRPVVRALHQDTWEDQLTGKHSKLVSDAIAKESCNNTKSIESTESTKGAPTTRKSGRVTHPVVCALHQDTWEDQLTGKHSKLVSDAIAKELNQLIKMQTWKPIANVEEATRNTIHKSITGSKLIVKEKVDANGVTLLWKARLVAQGHTISREKYDPFDRTAHTVPTVLKYTA